MHSGAGEDAEHQRQGGALADCVGDDLPGCTRQTGVEAICSADSLPMCHRDSRYQCLRADAEDR